MSYDTDSKVAVVGAGAWGTALACVAASKGQRVAIWGRNEGLCTEISERRTNSHYLPDVLLPSGIEASTNLPTALEQAAIVLLVVPAQTAEEVADQVFRNLPDDVPIVCCSKGINRKTRLTPAQSLMQSWPGRSVAALSGPSFAADVSRGLPTAVTLASSNTDFALELAQKLAGPRFRIYASDNIVSVELGGALKNVIALAVGTCRGLGLGASAEASIISRGFREISEIAVKMGGQQQTLNGLSGLGDLVLTCSNEMSRNFRYGMALARGEDTTDLPLAEGAKTAGVAAEIVGDLGLDCAVIETIDKVVRDEITAAESVDLLLSRPLKSE